MIIIDCIVLAAVTSLSTCFWNPNFSLIQRFAWIRASPGTTRSAARKLSHFNKTVSISKNFVALFVGLSQDPVMIKVSSSSSGMLQVNLVVHRKKIFYSQVGRGRGYNKYRLFSTYVYFIYIPTVYSQFKTFLCCSVCLDNITSTTRRITRNKVDSIISWPWCMHISLIVVHDIR